MVFSSLTFLYGFFPLCLILYFSCKNAAYRNTMLTVVSLVFYAWGEPVYVILMIFSSLFNYVLSLYIDKYRQKPAAKTILIFAVIGNLAILGFFKYLGFFASTWNAVSGMNIPIPVIGLPIGISFYTFQTMSYTIDVYRGDVRAQHSFIKLLMYVSLFPQLIAGPIVRYSDIEREIEDRTITPDGFSRGICRFAAGLAKKVLIANSCGTVVETFFEANAPASVAGYWFGMLMFAFQIYFDFSGYSDMAIGLGRMFGFTYKENFDYPYISRTATEFWRRWHISLGSFFRDYLYIPLGGNRRMWLRNLFVVWFLTGLWHGASWNFVIWGLYYGFLICIERLFLGGWLKKLPAFASYIYMAFVTLIGWTVFYFTDTSAMLTALKSMLFLGGVPLSNAYVASVFIDNVFLLAAALFFSLPIAKLIGDKLFNGENARLAAVNVFLRPALTIALMLICTIMLVGKTYNPFLYFRF